MKLLNLNGTLFDVVVEHDGIAIPATALMINHDEHTIFVTVPDEGAEDAKRYKIVRFFADDRPSEVLTRGMTLEQAKAHCQCEDSQGEDWFDGYDYDEESA